MSRIKGGEGRERGVLGQDARVLTVLGGGGGGAPRGVLGAVYTFFAKDCYKKFVRVYCYGKTIKCGT